MNKAFWILPVSAAATAALLPLNFYIVPQWVGHWTDNFAVNRMITAQSLTLLIAFGVISFTYLLRPDGFRKYARTGDLSAVAERVPWLGIKRDESWRSVGIGFSLAITLGTGLLMWAGVYSKSSIDWWGALPWVLLFSLTNSFSEEMLTRFSIVAALDGVVSPSAIRWWCAGIFGGIHYFGTPGGILGVLMAGFLGWILAKSVLETRGMVWAWFIHFLQDVVILFALLGMKG